MTDIDFFSSYTIGSEKKLTSRQKQQLVSCFEKPVQTAQAVLGGRAAVTRIRLEDIGPVVVKNYTRGGFIRNFNKNTYLKFSRYRCQSEYELLLFLQYLGVSVPKPVAFAYRGGFLYHAWLVTAEIKNARILIDVGKEDPDTARAAMKDLKNQVDILVENQIHHVDLHPGNVILDDQNHLFIIDFDKALTTPQNRQKLKQNYIRRWQRALHKHKLPAVLNLD